MIRYVSNQKPSITCVFCSYYAKIKIDFCDSLPLEKTLTFLTILILVK